MDYTPLYLRVFKIFLKIQSFMLLNDKIQNFNFFVNYPFNVPPVQLGPVIQTYSSSVFQIQDGPNLIPSSPSILLHVSPLPSSLSPSPSHCNEIQHVSHLSLSLSI